MDKMREEMWKRARHRLHQQAVEDAYSGKLWEVLLTMNVIDERRLIFGSSYTGSKS